MNSRRETMGPVAYNPDGDPNTFDPTDLGAGLAVERSRAETGSRTIVWDLDRRAAIGDLDFDTARSFLSPDGGTLYTIANNRLSSMPIDPQAWADHLCRVVGRDMTQAERQALVPGNPTGAICPR